MYIQMYIIYSKIVISLYTYVYIYIYIEIILRPERFGHLGIIAPTNPHLQLRCSEVGMIYPYNNIKYTYH